MASDGFGTLSPSCHQAGNAGLVREGVDEESEHSGNIISRLYPTLQSPGDQSHVAAWSRCFCFFGHPYRE